MLVGVWLKYENVGFMITFSVLKCVIVNVTVSGIDSMCCGILSSRTPLCMMVTIQTRHNVCVCFLFNIFQDPRVCSVMVMAGISAIFALEFWCVE
jgi:hypothetical protein